MALIDCIYINLSAATDRRTHLTRNFAESRFSSDWKLQRLEAIDTAYVTRNQIPGRIRDAEKACYLSHLHALKLAMKTSEYTLIAEDDVSFCARSEAAIDAAIDRSPDSWDILFTDVCVPATQDMLALFLHRRVLKKTDEFILIDLSDLFFAGATSYIVNRKSKAIVYNTLAQQQSFDIPYDLYLRNCIRDGKLKAYSIFPFATSLSPYSDNSAIQFNHGQEYLRNFAWNSFRRLMWIGADTDAVDIALSKMNEDFADKETSVFSTILKTILAKEFV
jgi:GR25 family glycosyltransferase involved in LPS biosynthesis